MIGPSASSAVSAVVLLSAVLTSAQLEQIVDFNSMAGLDGTLVGGAHPQPKVVAGQSWVRIAHRDGSDYQLSLYTYGGASADSLAAGCADRRFVGPSDNTAHSSWVGLTTPPRFAGGCTESFPADGLRFTFNNAVRQFRLRTVDLAENGGSCAATFFFKAYSDAAGLNVVDEFERSSTSANPNSGVVYDWTVSDPQGRIVRVDLWADALTGCGGWGIDSIGVIGVGHTVPAPAWAQLETFEGASWDTLPDLTSVASSIGGGQALVINGVGITLRDGEASEPSFVLRTDSVASASGGACATSAFNGANQMGDELFSSRSRLLAPCSTNFFDTSRFTFEFDRPVSYFSLATVDLCEDVCQEGRVFLEAFSDLAGTQSVSLFSRECPATLSGGSLPWAVAAASIRRVDLYGPVYLAGEPCGHGFALDNLEVAAAPGSFPHPVAAGQAHLLLQGTESAIAFDAAGSVRLGEVSQGGLGLLAPGGLFVEQVDILAELIALVGSPLPQLSVAPTTPNPAAALDAMGTAMKLGDANAVSVVATGSGAISFTGRLAVDGIDLVAAIDALRGSPAPRGPTEGPATAPAIDIPSDSALVQFGESTELLAVAGSNMLSINKRLFVNHVDIVQVLLDLIG